VVTGLIVDHCVADGSESSKIVEPFRPDRSTGIARRSGRSNLNIDSIMIELVAGARNTRFLRLVERSIPKLAA
jgi:N-glycosylase/DNA lyase